MNKFIFFILISFLAIACTEKTTAIKKVDILKELPDDLVDATISLQAQIDAADKLLELEPKRYLISGSLQLKSNLHIKGNGATIICSEDKKFVAMILEGIENVSILDLSIVGQQKINGNPHNNSRGSFLIRTRKCKNIQLKNVTVRDHAFTGSYFTDNINLTIKNCLFENIGYKSPDYSPPVPHYDYDGLFLGAGQLSKNIEISNCRFINMGPGDGDGIHTQTLKANTLQDVVIKDCYFEKCSARCIKMQSGSNFKIFDNQFYDSFVGVGISMANDVDSVHIYNNNFDSIGMVWGTNGIWNVVANDINFSNNIIKNAGQVYRTSGKSKMTNFVISNNVVDGIEYYFIDGLLFNGEITNNKISNFGLRKNKSLYMGILIAGDSENVVIKNNEISTKVKTHCAIYIQKTTKNIQVFNNKISMPLTGLNDGYIIHFSGTNAHKIAANKKALLDNEVVLR